MERWKQLGALTLFVGIGGAWVGWAGWSGCAPRAPTPPPAAAPPAEAAPTETEARPTSTDEVQEVVLPSSKAFVPPPAEVLLPSTKAAMPPDVLMPSSKAGISLPLGEVTPIDEILIETQPSKSPNAQNTPKDDNAQKASPTADDEADEEAPEDDE